LSTGTGNAAAVDAFSWSAWAGIALGVTSLVFNILNARRTTRIQENVRSTTVKLAQFEKLRVPVDACLTDLEKEQMSLRSLEVSDRSIEKIVKAVEESNKKIAEIDGQISTALKKLDDSSFADGHNWATQYGDDYDAFNDIINGVYSPLLSEDKKRAAIKKSSQKLETLIKNVQVRIEGEVERISGTK
jgi:hypothetical protein